MTAFKGTTFEKARTSPEMWGRWVESAIGAHLVGMAEEMDCRVHYWREDGDEVDFVVEAYGECIAIEVKSGKRKSGRGMARFCKAFSPRRSLTVGPDSISIEEFLKCRVSELF